MADLTHATGWRRYVGCLVFICQFPHSSPDISGFFAERDVQLKASYAASPPCTVLDVYIQSERGIRRKRYRIQGCSPGRAKGSEAYQFFGILGSNVIAEFVCMCVCVWLIDLWIWLYLWKSGVERCHRGWVLEFRWSGLDGTNAADASDTESPEFDMGHPSLTHSWRSRRLHLWLCNSDDSVYGWLCFRDIYAYICTIYLKVILMALTPLTPLTVENGWLRVRVILFQR